jgi:hypothetical protein
MSDVSREKRWGVAPYFIVDDVVTTANFYRDKLGFQYERFWGEPPCFCMPFRNGVVIMLAEVNPKGQMRPNNLVPREGGAWDAYIWVDDAKGLHDEFVSKGVKIERALCEQAYGNLDFDILDNNGYRLCFGSDLKK